MRRDVFYSLIVCFIVSCVASLLLILHHTGVSFLTVPEPVVYRAGLTSVVTFIALLGASLSDDASSKNGHSDE